MLRETKIPAAGKKYMKYLLIPFLALTIVSLNGCILDAFKTLTQELPYTVNVTIHGSQTSVEQSTTVNLNDNDFYVKNQAKINHIQLVKIAFKAKTVTPTNMSANITLTVKQSNGVVLFSKVIPGLQPSAYTTNPYELSLTQAEIQLVNAYLGILSNRVFTATLSITNASAGDKTLEAQVYAVFNMDYDL